MPVAGGVLSWAFFKGALEVSWRPVDGDGDGVRAVE